MLRGPFGRLAGLRGRQERRRRPLAAWTAALAGLALLVGCGGADAPPTPSTTTEPSDAATPPPEEYAAELIELTNEVRAEEGLEPLESSACAQEAALERAAALVGERELVHAPLAPVIGACDPLRTAAENLVNSTASPADVVDAWLGSPGHRANIVDPELTEIGIGCVPDAAQLLCSQVFLGP